MSTPISEPLAGVSDENKAIGRLASRGERLREQIIRGYCFAGGLFATVTFALYLLADDAAERLPNMVPGIPEWLFLTIWAGGAVTGFAAVFSARARYVTFPVIAGLVFVLGSMNVIRGVEVADYVGAMVAANNYLFLWFSVLVVGYLTVKERRARNPGRKGRGG